MRFWVFLIVLMVVAQPLYAQPTRYVTDELRVDVRSGPTNQHRIIRFIPSGQAFQELARHDEWVQVRLNDGEEGWIRTQYVSETPSARDQLRNAGENLQQARNRAIELQTQLDEQGNELRAAQASVQELTQSNRELERRLEDAGQGLELFEDNRELNKQIVDLRREVENRDAEIARLSDRSRQDWFVVGAGVLFAGMIVGLIVPRIRWRKQSSWGGGL